MHILMEYASGGTLDGLIDRYKAKKQLLPEALVWDCMVQLCGALKYCHSRNIMHRDIKPQNVMLSTPDERTCRLLLGDFGIAKIMAHQGAQTKELAGTPYYYSPELCKGLAYDNKSDMWAIGVVLFELMAQRRPFESTNTFRVLRGPAGHLQRAAGGAGCGPPQCGGAAAA
jgi:NIMA (never in mitosis gene a)-related kinase